MSGSNSLMNLEDWIVCSEVDRLRKVEFIRWSFE